MSGDFCVVHLVWRPLGPSVLQRFAESYRRHGAGCDHRLVVLYNGFRPGEDRTPWRSILAEVPHQELLCPRRMIDLAAYRFAIDRVSCRHICFLNSYSEICSADWLARYARHLARPGIGIVGATGSWESAWTSAPRMMRWPSRRGFEPFPNPHVRTNGFAMPLALARELDWPPPRRKWAAYLLESGRNGLTRQITARGMQALVVGRDGLGYPPERWRDSATFRSGDQQNLLIVDNRTDQYASAPPDLRAALERMCWGESASRLPAR